MGVVTVSSSARQTPLGLGARFSSSNKTPLKRPLILAFKSDNKNNKSTALVTTSPERIPLSAETPKPHTRRKRASSSRKRVKVVVSTDEPLACDVDLDYSEAATKLENLYKLSPPSDVEDSTDQGLVKRRGRRTKKKDEKVEEVKKEMEDNVTKIIQKKKMKRLSLDKRIAIRRKEVTSSNKAEDRDADRLVREYSVATTDLVSLDWKKMKIPPVLPSSEHTWLFKLMQPMKALLKVKESLHKDFGREPTDGELAAVTSMDIPKVQKQIEVGLAARNKLIKHNLRLVLFVINKYFQEFANGSRFQDLCQAGVKGLITAIDRFEPKRRFRLSTYGLFWIRHAIMRSMTLSSFTRVSFGLESVRIEIQRTKLELTFELGREPTEQEILEKVGISPERYREVMRASKPVYSLNARHPVTQEEFIDALTDVDGVGGDKRRQPALLRLALDDVLDSLKPKESLVIRQRYGLDGKGDRTLGEIAGNLNISREMVRKHEVKALMKLKHPARVDYLRRYIF